MAKWAPGDIALCIKGGKISSITFNPPNGFPRAGAVYTVSSVGRLDFADGETEALWFVDAPPNTNRERVWGSHRFVKVTPGRDIDGVEVERKVPKAVTTPKERTAV